jgi:hypothetical protein
MREEFEKAFPVPENCDWWSVLEAYSTKNRSTVHPYNDKWQAWQAATALQAERVRELEEALQAIVNPILYLRTEAEKEGGTLNGAAAVALSKDAEFLKSIARQALSATARVSA